MAQLKIFKNSQKYKELALEPGKEYFAGRSESVDLPLEADRGISRQHLKIYFDGQWIVEVVSRYGELYQNGQKQAAIHLKSGDRFEVPPYEFVFEDLAMPVMTEIQPSDEVPGYDEDRTYVGVMTATPYLRVCDANNDVVQIFRLEGQSWVAGRDTSATIFIDNQKFSRRHFEIAMQEGVFLIKDLGSSNGTLLNGQPLSSAEWVRMASGDVITVVDWSLYFELRDANFEERLQEISPEFRSPIVYDHQGSNQEMPFQADVLPGPVGYPPSNQAMDYGNFGQIPTKKPINWVRMIIGLLVIGGGLFYYMNQIEKPPETLPQAKTNLSPFDRLTPKQQQFVRDTYRMADQLFKEGRYVMAKQEITKIHQLVPVFEDSKNLEKLADVAVQTQLEQEKAASQEKDQAEMEEKIQKTVAACRTKINSQIEMSTIDECLSPIIALAPEHPAILSLKSQVDQLINERMAKQEQKSEYQALIKKQKAIFERAEKISKSSSDPKEAIRALQSVVNSKLPDPGNTREQAKRQISSIQQGLVSKEADFERQADAAYKKSDYKTAIDMIKKAIQVNPDNESLRGKMNSMLTDLKKQMQTFYQEGVLEESVGEVETAKGKWKKIIESSVPEEDYYKKAKSKLKKYGVE